MSPVRACAPVPLTGQSSATWPALRSARSAATLSSSVNVLASITTRRFFTGAIAPTVAASACGFGRLVMMTGTAAASALASLAISTPFLAARRRHAASMS